MRSSPSIDNSALLANYQWAAISRHHPFKLNVILELTQTCQLYVTHSERTMNIYHNNVLRHIAFLSMPTG